jgi:rubredoxin
MAEPIPMILTCPNCSARHVDKGEFATKPHHTHACQTCGLCWRPAIVPTVGVQFLPGFKDEDPTDNQTGTALIREIRRRCPTDTDVED